MKTVEKSILNLKLILNNFASSTSGIKSFSRNFYNSIKIVYDKNSSYGGLGNDICECHSQVEKAYDDLINLVNEVNFATTDWNTMFTEAKVNSKIKS